MKIFGPIPSRRLGRSLGVNNIPHKICSYSCIYCQVGKTSRMVRERQTYYNPEDILKEVTDKILNIMKVNGSIDYISFVPDGEPTLDKNLGRTIELLKLHNIKIAVFTNGSLLSRKDVQEDLLKADLISIKIDSVIENVWTKINRPHRKLALSKVIEGIDCFCQHFKGELLTEIMLVKDVNDSNKSLIGTAELVNWIEPSKAYLLIPTRPPAESWVKPPANEVINKAFQIFNARIKRVELLAGYEGNDFTYTGNLEDELISTLSVHPMREDALESFITKSEMGESVLHELLLEKKLVQVEYGGEKFYQRNFNSKYNLH